MKRVLAAIMMLALLLPGAPSLAEEAAYAATPLSNASAAQLNNIELAAAAIDGWELPYGASFSFNAAVGPRTRDFGYRTAENGRGVSVTGGGVAQVASTIYLAVQALGGEIEVDDVRTYGEQYVGSYVSDPSDAVLVDYNSDIDFSFTNYGADIMISVWLTDEQLCCALDYSDFAPIELSFMDWTPEYDYDWTMDYDWAESEEWMPSYELTPSFMRVPIAQSQIELCGSEAMCENIILAAGSINDTVLMRGDSFSFNETVGPRIERYGYRDALNGRGVEVTGGGVAQVASALWLAVKQLDFIAIAEKSTYGSSYSESYVLNSNDAILTDYNGGTDFSFINKGDSTIRISVYVQGDVLHCELYQEE